MPAPKSKAIDPWEKMDRIMENRAEPLASDGWFTIQDFLDRYPKETYTSGRNTLLKMVSQGKAEKWVGKTGLANSLVSKFRLI